MRKEVLRPSSTGTWISYRGDGMKIGEVISASVLSGIEVKLGLESPEGLKVGYPIIVEGASYSFYCIVQDVYIPRSEVIDRIAGSRAGEALIPLAGHEGVEGRLFSPRARLKPVQLIDRDGRLGEPETIPHYLAPVRLAEMADVEKIYTPAPTSLPIGNLRGLKDFPISLDFKKLVEKPFALFGRTGMGKSILSKIVCCGILGRGVASVLIFDMHQEYGMFSRTDNSPGLKYFFPEGVEVFTLDPEGNREAKPFLIDPREITPADIIVAFQDVTPQMVDALYAVQRRRGARDLISAITEATPEEYEGKVHGGALQALQRRVERFGRFGFVQGTTAGDAFHQMVGLVRAGKSIVLDFGRYGHETTAYLFVANLLARRLYELYTEGKEDYPRLVVFLEEAHKFLDPSVAPYTIFDRLARETRKFNLILGLVDQRPSRIDEEVRSQIANRLLLSLKDPADVASALAGIPDRAVWEGVLSSIPPRSALVVGDAIRVPTVVEIMEYGTKRMKDALGKEGLDGAEMEEISRRAEKLFE